MFKSTDNNSIREKSRKEIISIVKIKIIKNANNFINLLDDLYFEKLLYKNKKRNEYNTILPPKFFVFGSVYFLSKVSYIFILYKMKTIIYHTSLLIYIFLFFFFFF